MKQKLLFTLLVCCASLAYAQDSVLINKNLKEVEIVEKRPTLQTLNIYQQSKSYNLSTLLDQGSGNLLKFNGPVGVATANFGGFGGQHSAIIWGGLNLQSTMNGVADLNLIPTFLFDDIAFGTDFGNQPLGGGIGGIVELNNTRTRNDVMINFASFKNYKLGIALSPLNKHKLKLTSKVFATSGKNDFFYSPQSGRKRMANAEFRQFHLQNNFSYLLNSKTQLKVDQWSFVAFRQIPPSRFAAKSNAFQNDRNHRISASLLRKHDQDNKKRTLVIRTGYLNEHIGFTDSTAKIFGDNNAQSLFAIAKHGWERINYVNDISTSFILEANSGLHWAKTNDYVDFSSIQHPFKNISLNARFQQKGFAERWLYAFGGKLENFMGYAANGFDVVGKYRIDEKIFLSAFAGKTYKFPTFNDLYWSPGGNNQLIPEEAYKGHLQVDWSGPVKKSNIRLWAQFHTAYVNNWIMWLQNQQGIWEAQNVKSVWARGFDLRYSISRYINWKYFLKLNGNYAFTRTENLGNSAFLTEGSQLNYVPYHKLNQFISVRRNSLLFTWHYQMVGERFTNADNSESLPAYHLNNVIINYSRKSMDFSFEINNIFNVDYESTIAIPMPGRNFSFTINYKLKK
ncbi:MAG: TonB-dependent receptor [Bacteroidia bacterium]